MDLPGEGRGGMGSLSWLKHYSVMPQFATRHSLPILLLKAYPSLSSSRIRAFDRFTDSNLTVLFPSGFFLVMSCISLAYMIEDIEPSESYFLSHAKREAKSKKWDGETETLNAYFFLRALHPDWRISPTLQYLTIGTWRPFNCRQESERQLCTCFIELLNFTQISQSTLL